jgi:hypothetical protein
MQFLYYPSPKKFSQKKCPARNRGTSPALFLAKNAQSLRHRRVAWLTALSAAYSGGTAADFHGLPRCPCLQIENRVYVAHRRCVNASTNHRSWNLLHLLFSTSTACTCVSDSSRSVFAFPPKPASPLVNLPTGTIHSGKYSWNFSIHLSATFPSR